MHDKFELTYQQVCIIIALLNQVESDWTSLTPIEADIHKNLIDWSVKYAQDKAKKG